MTLVSRAARVTTGVRRGGDGWRVVTVACPCAVVSKAVPPWAMVADVIEEARAQHRQETPRCPHLPR
jgi:hypothetical protein